MTLEAVMEKLVLTCGLLMASLACADDVKVPAQSCTHVSWSEEEHEWLCPSGIHYVLETASGKRVVAASKGQGKCAFNSRENLWICPPGLSVVPAEKTIVKTRE